MTTIAEKLMHSTVRLECTLKNGGSSIGTGFFFSFKIDEEKFIHVIVTNKHVIRDSSIGIFTLTTSDENNQPIIGEHHQIRLDNFESHWIFHPEEDIDLAVFSIVPLLNHAENNRVKFFNPSFNESLIPSVEQLNNLSGIENITMIGYPNAIWDSKNNLPIVRRGITATSPKYDYNGNPIFLIDCACFGGSSGSPVLIFDNGNSYMNASGTVNLAGNRVILLGILSSGPLHYVEGEIKLKEVDMALQQVQIPISWIPINLGYVIKAQKILDFKSLLMDKRK